MNNLPAIIESIEDSLRQLDELIAHINEQKEKLKSELERRLEQLQFTNYNLNGLDEFLEEPYCVLPKRKDEFWVVVPKFVNFHVGWLEHETKSYYVFAINKYMQWITHLPDELKERLRFQKRPPLKVFDGILLTGREHQDEAWRQYRDFLLRREGDDRIKIKKGYEFKLIAKLIEDGILPFIPRPVEESDLRDWGGIELRDYQKKAWKEFIDKGAIGVFWGFGSGKSVFGLYALARIKGKKLVVVPTRTLVEQWIKRIKQYIPEYANEVEVITYHSHHKVARKEYTLVVYDEVHHLPANTFIKFSTIKTKYRIGLSGSPFREDKRENYIFALTGFPVGLSWDELLKQRIVRAPDFKLYILSDVRKKFNKLEELLKIPVKTIIFCDSIELGKKISKKFDIPFVYGETNDRLEIIKSAQQCVVSRVGDEGLSLPDIERVIEVDFLYGSRAQESQRFGRLMHGRKDRAEHIILMTEEEYEKYHKRLYAITERGFRVEVIR